MPIGLYPAIPLSAGASLAPNLIETDGAVINNGAAFGLLSALSTNGSAAAGAINWNAQAGAAYTLTNIAGATLVLSQAGAVTLTLDYAYNVVNQMQGPYMGQKFPLTIATYGAGGSVATPTLSDTAITLAGTTSLVATSLRFYQGTITQLTTTTAYVPISATWTSLAQVGSTNAFTVTLGANSAATPTVGTVIYLGTTAGTLPPGWYPIVKATSATSFVIATPPGTVWTATAMTFSTVGTAPATYSPLITIQGMFSTVTAIIAA